MKQKILGQDPISMARKSHQLKGNHVTGMRVKKRDHQAADALLVLTPLDNSTNI